MTHFKSYSYFVFTVIQFFSVPNDNNNDILEDCDCPKEIMFGLFNVRVFQYLK